MAKSEFGDGDRFQVKTLVKNSSLEMNFSRKKIYYHFSLLFCILACMARDHHKLSAIGRMYKKNLSGGVGVFRES